MSDSQDLTLDLEKAFLPAWAQKPEDPNRFARYDGGDDRRRDDRGGRGDRGPRRDFGGGGGFGGGQRRGPGGPGGPGGGGPGRGGPFGGGRDRGGDRGPRPGTPRTGVAPGTPLSSAQGAPNLSWDPSGAGAPRQDRGDRRGPRGGDRGDRRGGRDFRPEPLIPVECVFVPEPNGAASLARQIRLSCRAFPLFEVAGLVIQKPDRYDVTLRVVKGKDGKPEQPLFACSLDDTLWLSEADALRHILAHHFDTFYSTEKVATDAPKGTYTFVAQCGFSGEILGPPNYHGYQDKLRKLHAERFNRMPFDMFKARVRIVKDEAVVKEWLESQSSRSEYTTLNVPEPIKLASREAVEQHFRETHLANLVRSVDSAPIKREQFGRLPGPLQTLIRVSADRERRFPIRIATALSQSFAQAGLQFFKRDRTIVHVAVARPHHLDLTAQVVSDGVKKIVAHIEANPKTTRKELIDALAPLPAGTPAAAPAPAAEAAATPTEVAAPAEAPATSAPATSSEREAVLTDLHWLLHQGHVIEFASGAMELAKKPGPRTEGQAPEAPKAAGQPAEGRRGRRGEQGDRGDRPPRQDRTPWSRKTGLMPVTSPGYPPYSAVPQLVGI